MSIKTYKTIIIGGGISALGCAHKLIENKYANFKLISPEIGGRILESKNNQVEYGAYYVMSIYHNTASFINLGHRIKLSSLRFHKSTHSYKLFDKKLYSCIFQLIRLFLILRKFKKHYELFKHKCLFQSQINCLKSDAYLWKLYNSNAKSFIKEKSIEKIVYNYLAEALHGTTFLPIKCLNAFEFLHFSLPLIVPIYLFNFRKKEAINLVKDNWIKDQVISIKVDSGRYKVLTKNKAIFFCEKIVMATPPIISKHLLKFKESLREPANAHMFHLSGDLKHNSNKDYTNLFNNKSRMLAIAKQKDGSYLLYTTHKKPNFDNYFSKYKIIKHKYWNPAFNIGGSNIINFNQGRNLFLIGDNNICGIEDSYIYGMYAANKILGKTMD